MKDVEDFYALQRTHIDQDTAKPDRKKFHASWFDESTVDFWRHKRMYQMVGPFAPYYKGGTWLTIGDGRYGLDSVRLKKLFSIRDILPTDISSTMLSMGKEKGLFDRYGVENAEKLSFEDGAFDVVFCKEAFHHFPRPILALYEMIRVSKTAVILIEPVDYPTCQISKRAALLACFKALYSIVNKGVPFYPSADISAAPHVYEASGNYKYLLSLREIEKIAHGMDLGAMAWRGFNDCYQEGCEFEPAVEGNPVFEHIRNSIESADRNCLSYPAYFRYSSAVVTVFKNPVARELQQEMEKFGYEFLVKASNPAFGRS